MTRDSTILMAAARLIETRGLAKGTLEDDDGRICAFGAINLAHHGDIGYVQGDDSRAIAVRIFGTYPFELARWSNAPTTTKDEVISLLESGAYSVQP